MNQAGPTIRESSGQATAPAVHEAGLGALIKDQILDQAWRRDKGRDLAPLLRLAPLVRAHPVDAILGMVFAAHLVLIACCLLGAGAIVGIAHFFPEIKSLISKIKSGKVIAAVEAEVAPAEAAVEADVSKVEGVAIKTVGDIK